MDARKTLKAAPVFAPPPPPSWRLIGADETGRRVTTACSECGLIREFNRDVFRDGHILSCDCVRLAVGRAGRIKSFAARLAAAERHAAPNRHRGGTR